MLGPLTAFLILRQAADGYDAVFTVSFCVAAVGVLVLLLFVPSRTPVAALPEGAPRASLKAALALLRVRTVRQLTLAALLLGLATVSDSFVYLLLQHRLGVPDRWFALLPSARRPPSCSSPYRWAVSPTRWAAGRCSSAATRPCSSRTSCS